MEKIKSRQDAMKKGGWHALDMIDKCAVTLIGCAITAGLVVGGYAVINNEPEATPEVENYTPIKPEFTQKNAKEILVSQQLQNTRV